MQPRDRHRLAQSLSAVENRKGNWRQVLAESYGAAPDLFITGITGPPGSGKSTLIDALAAHWAQEGRTVGVLAIDPSSPFSGGAILGDRLRMRLSEDLDTVFIRSMSARGHAGGLNAAALDLCTVMAAQGCSHVLLEAVGSGQSEVDIGFVADCTLVVAVPGLGDSVQAAKAGLMEIGDLYVVNKSDLPHAGPVRQDLASMLGVSFPGKPGSNEAKDTKDAHPRAVGAMPKVLAERYGDPDGDAPYWHPPVLPASNAQPDSIAAISVAVADFRQWLAASGRLAMRRRHALAQHALNLTHDRFIAHMRQQLDRPAEAWIGEAIAQGSRDPYELADRIMDLTLAQRGTPP